MALLLRVVVISGRNLSLEPLRYAWIIDPFKNRTICGNEMCECRQLCVDFNVRYIRMALQRVKGATS